MAVISRWKKILKLLEENDFMTVEELMKALGISSATIRRDLSAMEEQGQLERLRGGAKRISKPYQLAHKITTRMQINKEEKLRIAKKAALLIDDNDYIFMDSSTSVYYMIDFITAENITVVTNAISVIPKLLEKNIATYVLNGYVDADSNSIIADDVSKQIATMNFNKSFIGTYGIDLQNGFNTYDTRDGAYKKNIVAHSETTYILADHSKFKETSFFTFAKIGECHLITDSNKFINETIENVIIV